MTAITKPVIRRVEVEEHVNVLRANQLETARRCKVEWMWHLYYLDDRRGHCDAFFFFWRSALSTASFAGKGRLRKIKEFGPDWFLVV